MEQKFKIPKDLEVVIKKLHKEIVEIEIHEIETVLVYDPMTFEPVEQFVIHLKLKLDNYDKNPFQLRDKFNNDLATSFEYTYPDIDFIQFRVIGFIDEPKKTNREIMMELFSEV